MTDKEIEYIKNLTIEDVKKFYPDVIDDDFQIMKVIIEYGVLQKINNFSNITQCLIYVLEETSKVILKEQTDMKSIYRDILIDDILKLENE